MAGSDTFTFTGQQTTGWYRYRDTATGSMLVAEPGGTYQIQALEPGLPVPPGGQWLPSGTAAAKAVAKAAADAQAAAAQAPDTSEAVPASAQGGDV